MGNFDDLHLVTLDDLLAERGLELSVEERRRLVDAWHQLDPWPDVRAGLKALRRRYVTAALSNGHLALLVDLARYADLRFGCVLSAELAHAYKPAPEVYQTGARLLGIAPAELMLVAAHPWDLESAREAGLRTAFVERPLEYGAGSAPRADADADESVADLHELAGCRRSPTMTPPDTTQAQTTGSRPEAGSSVGVGVTPFQTDADAMIRLAVRGEKLGYARFCSPEGWTHDAVVLLAQIAGVTSRIGLTTAVLPIRSRRPAAIAMAAASPGLPLDRKNVRALRSGHRPTARPDPPGRARAILVRLAGELADHWLAFLWARSRLRRPGPRWPRAPLARGWGPTRSAWCCLSASPKSSSGRCSRPPLLGSDYRPQILSARF